MTAGLSLPTYKNEEYGIIEYFAEQKRQGRIRHLGFSIHARAENLEGILDYLESKLGAKPDFCPQQIDIPSVMKEFAEMLDKAPSWAELCKQR